MVALGLPIFVALLFIIIVSVAIGAAKQKERNDMSLKKAYLYLVSVISLVIAVVGAIMLLNMALKAWVFPKADQVYSYPVCAQLKTPDGGASSECDPKLSAEQQKRDEENRSAQRQRDAAQALAMIVVATPVWWYHWTQARKEA
jgi:Co/Zn/Cd efflux system component